MKNNSCYKILITKKPESKFNPFHEELDSTFCFIDFLEIGHPLLGHYKPKGNNEIYFRLFNTSTVLNIEEKEDGNIFVETKNSYFKFEIQEQESE